MKKKMLRQAFISSVMSLVLCCAMLIGTTFAWFSESIKSAEHVFQSGNMVMTVEYRSGNSWKKINSETDLSKLFFAEPWEARQARYIELRVANDGTMPFAYSLNIGPAAKAAENSGLETATDSEGSELTSLELLDLLQVGYIEGIPEKTDDLELIAEVLNSSGSVSLAEGIQITGELEGNDFIIEETEESEPDSGDESEEGTETSEESEDDFTGDVITLVIYMPQMSIHEIALDEEEEYEKLFDVSFSASQIVDEEDILENDSEEESGEGAED